MCGAQVYQQTGAAAVSSFVKFYKGDITATTSAAALSATPGVEQWFQVHPPPPPLLLLSCANPYMQYLWAAVSEMKQVVVTIQSHLRHQLRITSQTNICCDPQFG